MSNITELQKAVFKVSGVTPPIPIEIGALLRNRGTGQIEIIIGCYWNIAINEWYYLCTNVETLNPPIWIDRNQLDAGFVVTT